MVKIGGGINVSKMNIQPIRVSLTVALALSLGVGFPAYASETPTDPADNTVTQPVEDWRDNNPVNWESDFPDPIFRSFIQHSISVICSGEHAGEFPICTKYNESKDFSRITYDDLGGFSVSSLDTLAELDEKNKELIKKVTSIQGVELIGNKEYDLISLPKDLCPKVPFTRGAITGEYNFSFCSFSKGVTVASDTQPLFSTNNGIYEFTKQTQDENGEPQVSTTSHTYSYSEGNSSTSFLAIRSYVADLTTATEDENNERGSNKLSKLWAPKNVGYRVIPRGVYTTIDYPKGYRVERTRLIDEVGTQIHRIKITNIGQTSITDEFVESLDTMLDKEDQVKLISDGKGGAILADENIALYVRPLSGIASTYAGRYAGGSFGVLTALDSADASTLSREECVAAPNKNECQYVKITDQPQGENFFAHLRTEKGEQLTFDSNIFFRVPVSLAPGQAHEFSYEISLSEASESYSATVEYVSVDAQGKETSIGRHVVEGRYHEVVDFSGLPGLDAQYRSGENSTILPAGYQRKAGETGALWRLRADSVLPGSVVLGEDHRHHLIKLYLEPVPQRPSLPFIPFPNSVGNAGTTTESAEPTRDEHAVEQITLSAPQKNPKLPATGAHADILLAFAVVMGASGMVAVRMRRR